MRDQNIFNSSLDVTIFTPWMICADSTCACLVCLMMYGSRGETEGSVWTQQRGEWDGQVALISGRPQRGDTRCIVFPPLASHTRSHEHTRAPGPAGSAPTICRGGQEPFTPRRWCTVSGCCLPPHPTVTSSTLHHIEPEVGHTSALIALNAQSVWVCGFALRALRTTRLWNYTLKENQYYKCWVLWCVPRAAGIKSLRLWLGFKPCQRRGFVDGTFGTVGVTLWSRLEYLNSYWMGCHDVRYLHSRSLQDDFNMVYITLLTTEPCGSASLPPCRPVLSSENVNLSTIIQTNLIYDFLNSDATRSRFISSWP